LVKIYLTHPDKSGMLNSWKPSQAPFWKRLKPTLIPTPLLVR
jgi:hypothetical protein